MENEKYLDFEERIAKLDREITELMRLSSQKGIDYSTEIRKLRQETVSKLKRIYSNLTAWQTVQVARHPKRPILPDYLKLMVQDFRELHGDRCFGDDRAIIIPVITLIDTPGAYPGIGAEERGQAQAIATNLKEMSRLRVPIICIVIGEGGSGGAIGIGVGDRLAMLEFAYYSVISPEGCAAILWRDNSKAEEAAEALKLTSKDLFKLGLIDAVIPEPLGGAHRNVRDTVYNVRRYITETLAELKHLTISDLRKKRYQKLRSQGLFIRI